MKAIVYSAVVASVAAWPEVHFEIAEQGLETSNEIRDALIQGGVQSVGAAANIAAVANGANMIAAGLTGTTANLLGAVDSAFGDSVTAAGNFALDVANAAVAKPLHNLIDVSSLAAVGTAAGQAGFALGSSLTPLLLPAAIHQELSDAANTFLQAHMQALNALQQNSMAFLSILFGLCPNGVEPLEFFQAVNEAIVETADAKFSAANSTVTSFLGALQESLATSVEVGADLSAWAETATRLSIFNPLLASRNFCLALHEVVLHIIERLTRAHHLHPHPFPTHFPPPIHTTEKRTTERTTSEAPTMHPHPPHSPHHDHPWVWSLADAAVFLLQKVDVFRPLSMAPEQFLEVILECARQSRDRFQDVTPQNFIEILSEQLESTLTMPLPTVEAIGEYVGKSLDGPFPPFDEILGHIQNVLEEKLDTQPSTE